MKSLRNHNKPEAMRLMIITALYLYENNCWYYSESKLSEDQEMDAVKLYDNLSDEELFIRLMKVINERITEIY